MVGRLLDGDRVARGREQAQREDDAFAGALSERERIGADVCGMSTVAETLAARSLGMRVLGLAFVTNLAFVKHDHREVLREAEKGRERMSTLLQDIITLP